MASFLGSIDAAPMPDHCLITIIGSDFDSFAHPDPAAGRLCWAGTEQIQLFSEISSGHRAYVTVEAWDGPPPPADTDGWEAHGSVTLHSTSGTLAVSVLDERLLTPYLQIGPPGRYTADVHATGRRQVRALYGQSAWYADDPPTGVERFRVRVWPEATKRP